MNEVGFAPKIEYAPITPLPDVARTTINLSALTYSDRTLRLVAEAIREAHSPELDAHGYMGRGLNGGYLERDIDIRVEGASLPKRIGSYLFNTYKIKLDREAAMKIGEIAAEAKGFTIEADLTRSLDWNRGDFGDRGSCFFGDRVAVRARTLPRMQASALRFWRNGAGIGRCFVIPVPRALTGNDYNAYLMCNHYGVHITPQRCAATLVHMLEKTLGGEWEAQKTSIDTDNAIDFYGNPSQPYVIAPKGTPTIQQVYFYRSDVNDAIPLPQWALDALEAYNERQDDDDGDDDFDWLHDEEEGG